MRSIPGRLASGIVCLFVFSAAVFATDRPNVVFILADDLGWSDTTLYGTTKLYRTPNIERLAARGMTFTRAYSASPLCSPTRAAILTGMSPARTGITTPACHLPAVVLEATPGKVAPPGSKSVPVNSVTRFKTDYQTLPKTLKTAGYAAGHFGKWHLGHEPYSPLEHGFDVDVPHWPGPGPAGSYVAPWKFKDFDHDPDVPDQHIEDRMASEAVRWMERHTDGPFFLNYWMFSVHAPFDAKRKLIDEYRGRIDPKDPQRSPTYAAMIESMDDAVGTLLDALDRMGLAENTIIVFASDNGGNMYNRVDDTTPTSNAPLRGGKATMFEGGVRGPCVVTWPGAVAAGTRSDVILQSCDFYPTLLDLLKLTPKTGQDFDGVSLAPVVTGTVDEAAENDLRNRPVFTYFPHNPRVPDWLPPAVSVHQGDWKLIRIFHEGDAGEHRWMLFNLRDDIGERHDLANKYPERVRELDALIDRFLVETDAVLPTRNLKFDPAAYRPEMIGKQLPKRTPRSKPASRTGRPSAPVAGWSPSRDCRLALKDDSLVITSLGRDPYLSFPLPKKVPKGDFQVELTLSSTGAGRGQFFWHEQDVQPAFFRERSVTFEMKHDGKPHSYKLRFSSPHNVLAVRLDPGQGAGEIRLSAMTLTDSDGLVLREWSFSAEKRGKK